MGLTDKRCRSCRYHGVLSNYTISCDYFLITGVRRGCPAGRDCTRFEKGVREKTPPQPAPSMKKLKGAKT